MSTAFAAHNPIADHTYDDVALAVAMLNAFGGGRNRASTELKPRWRVDEEEILRASITVILVALMTVVAVAVIAILTMG